MKRITIPFIFLINVLFLSTSHATLIDRGNGMIFDSDLNITWLQDANYAETSGFDSDGYMAWNEAMSWADGLIYEGYNDWRLPNLTDHCYGNNCTTGEMGHLYYSELNNDAYSFPDWNLINTEPFLNVGIAYWYSTEQDSDFAFFFSMFGGYQTTAEHITGFSAIAVRDGDVASVPEPSTLLLLFIGIVYMSIKAKKVTSLVV